MLMSRTQWRASQLMPATLTQYWGVFYIAFALTAWVRRDASTSVIGWMNAQWGESFVAGYLLTMFIVGVVLLIRPVPVKVFALGSVWFVLYALISFPVVIQDVGIPYEPLVVYSGLWVLSMYWVFYDHGFPHVSWRDQWVQIVTLNRLLGVIVVLFGLALLARPTGAIAFAVGWLLALEISIETQTLITMVCGVMLLLRDWDFRGYFVLSLPLLYITMFISVWLLATPDAPINPIPIHLMFFAVILYMAKKWSDERWQSLPRSTPV